MMKIGTAGFRGVIGEEYTKDAVCKIIQCTCDIISKQNFKREVVVGYDNRFMSNMFAQWTCQVLCANGIKALLTDGSVPSPLVSFANKYLKNDIGIMITASHNPYFYNGVKIFSKDGVDLELYIEKMYNEMLGNVSSYKMLDIDECEKNGLLVKVNYTKEYVKSIVNCIKFKDNLTTKTMFNVMNGSSLDAINELKNVLNLDVELFKAERDALFNNKGPIPNEDNLLDFKERALKNKVDFAFATDGDGDRLACFDDMGVFHNGNELVSLIYYFAIKEKHEKGPFVRNYSFSTLSNKICDKLNSQMIETPVGFKYIGEQLSKYNGLIGAENSGCEIYKHVLTKDGLIVYALLLEIVNYYKRPLSVILDDLKKEVNFDMDYIEVSFPVKNKEKINNYLKENTPKFSKKLVSKGNLDGFKYIFDDESWLLIRFSGTENLIRLVTEQPNKQATDKMIDEVKNIINSL